MSPIINKRINTYKREKESDKRDNANNKAVYNTNTWRKLRLMYLSTHPLCSRCLKKNKISSSTECHHIIPISKGQNKAEKQILGFDEKNLEAICSKCHDEHHNNERKNRKK
jgi:5-methylcytosine-specific restriction enzyme A